MHNLSPRISTVALSGAVAPGQTTFQTPILDTFGFGCVRAVMLLGTLLAASAVALKLQQGDAPDLSDAKTTEAAASCGTAANSNKLLILDVHRPQARYVRFILERSGADSGITAAFAELYNPANAPVMLDASVAAQAVKTEPLVVP